MGWMASRATSRGREVEVTAASGLKACSLLLPTFTPCIAHPAGTPDPWTRFVRQTVLGGWGGTSKTGWLSLRTCAAKGMSSSSTKGHPFSKLWASRGPKLARRRTSRARPVPDNEGGPLGFPRVGEELSLRSRSGPIAVRPRTSWRHAPTSSPASRRTSAPSHSFGRSPNDAGDSEQCLSDEWPRGMIAAADSVHHGAARKPSHTTSRLPHALAPGTPLDRPGFRPRHRRQRARGGP